MWQTSILRLLVGLQLCAQRLSDERGELSSQQVIWIGILVTLAITVGGIVTNLVMNKANSLNLG